MAGPHPPNDSVGSDGPQTPSGNPPVEYPHDQPGPPPANYAGQGAPVPYPARRSRRRLVIGVALALAVVAALTVAIVYGVRTNGANTGAAFSEGAAKSAIQNYFNALERRDVDEIVRNALCGMYDGVRDKRLDLSLAHQSSDAFRKQFSEAEVTSIDKIVYLSQYQAQALFTLRVAPLSSGPSHDQVQGIAQLLFQRGQITVCSYVLRTGASY